MAYTKQTWVDGPLGNTPVSSARLNYIEGGIESIDASKVTNLGGTGSVQIGLAANRPAVGVANRVYIESDGDRIIWWDNGTTWTRLGVTLGTGVNQAAAGNDIRLSDHRVPLDDSVTDVKVSAFASIAQSKLALAITDAQVAAGAAIAESKLTLASDAAAGTPSRRSLGTGATQAAPGNHTHIQRIVHTFFKTGVLAVGADAHRWYADEAWTIVEVRASVGTAPVGADLIVDLNINGVTAFTTQLNRPTIAATTNTDGSNVPDIRTLIDGDYLTFDIDQVGTTTAGSDLTVQVVLQRTA